VSTVAPVVGTTAANTTGPRPVATAPARTAAVVGRVATVAPDGTIDVRRVLDSGVVEAGRSTAAPASPWTAAVHVRDGDVLLYRANNSAQSAFIDDQGNATIEHSYIVGADYAFGTDIDDGWVYFYRRDGSVGWARIDESNNFVLGGNSQSSDANFDALAFAGARRVLQYDRETGNAWLVRVTTGNALASLARPKLAAGATVLAPTGREFVVAINGNGAATVLRVTDAGVETASTTTITGGSYSAAAAFSGGTIVLDRAAGQGRVVWISADGRVTRVDAFSAPRDALLVAVD
jgi:hypothetical protein